MATKKERETEYRRYNFLRIWDKRYYHMKDRVLGRSTRLSSARGKELISHREFIVWCKKYDNLIVFITIYMEWAESGFQEHLSPSIDRVDNNRGYALDNIRWLSVAENLDKKFEDASREN